MQTIDARAMSYPMTVMMASKALIQGCTELTVFVSDILSVESLTQLAGEAFSVEVAQKDGTFAVVFKAEAQDSGQADGE